MADRRGRQGHRLSQGGAAIIDDPAVLHAIWVSVNKWPPARKAYDRLAAAMGERSLLHDDRQTAGEGALLHDLAQMVGHAQLSPDRLKADAMRRDENQTMAASLAKIKAFLDRRQEKAVEDARTFNRADATIPFGFMAEIDRALAYFEADQPHARGMTGVGARSGGGDGARSLMSARFAAVGRFAEQVRIETGEPHDADVAVLAEALLQVGRSAHPPQPRGVAARDVARWRLDYARKQEARWRAAARTGETAC